MTIPFRYIANQGPPWGGGGGGGGGGKGKPTAHAHVMLFDPLPVSRTACQEDLGVVRGRLSLYKLF